MNGLAQKVRCQQVLWRTSQKYTDEVRGKARVLFVSRKDTDEVRGKARVVFVSQKVTEKVRGKARVVLITWGSGRKQMLAHVSVQHRSVSREQHLAITEHAVSQTEFYLVKL